MLVKTSYAAATAGQIAYQVFGEGPRDVLYLHAFGNVETQWDVPPLARFLERLSSLGRVIVFDRRGVGASDPVSLEKLPTWEEWADDILAVLDAADSTRAAVIGEGDSGPTALLFTAAHPERVESLVLFTTTAKFMASDDFPIGFPEEMVSAFVELFQRSWGTEELAKIALPSFADQPDVLSTFMKYVRTSATPHSASIQFDYMFRSIDTRAVLPSIQVPTLVLHRSNSVFLPIEFGRFLAENIPGARFAEVPGEDVYCFGAHSDDVLAEITEFVTGERPQEDLDRVLATVLFTDIVSSTQHLSDVGDRSWKEVLDRHDRVTRAQIERYRGREIDTTGDGFLAIFDGPARAIRCACAIRDEARTIGLEIRAGLHTGELELRGDGVAGIAVHLGARIAALAQANEVLVSRTVADLVAGSDIALVDRGEHDLKGIPDRWTLFAVAG